MQRQQVCLYSACNYRYKALDCTVNFQVSIKYIFFLSKFRLITNKTYFILATQLAANLYSIYILSFLS